MLKFAIIICLICAARIDAQTQEIWVKFGLGSSRISDIEPAYLSFIDSTINALPTGADLSFVGMASHNEWVGKNYKISDIYDDALRLGRARILQNRFNRGAITVGKENFAGTLIRIKHAIGNHGDSIHETTEPSHTPRQDDATVAVRTGVSIFFASDIFVMPKVGVTIKKDSALSCYIHGGIDFNGKGYAEIGVKRKRYSLAVSRYWKYEYVIDYWTERVTTLAVMMHFGQFYTGVGIGELIDMTTSGTVVIGVNAGLELTFWK